MRLGIGSYTFAWAVGVPGSMPEKPLTAFDLLDKASELGVGVVQICDNLALGRLEEAELEALARKAREMSIQIEVGTRGIGPDSLGRNLEIAERLGSPILRVVLDTDEHEPSPDEVVAAARDLAQELTRAGVCLAIENHDRFKTTTLVDIMSRVDDPSVGICLDTVNSFGALEGPEVVVERLGPFTANLHVKEFRIFRPPSQLGFTIEGAPVGEGQLNVPWLLEKLGEKLRATGRDPNAIIEQWTPPQETIEETIRMEEDWARRSVKYLRGLIPG